MPRDPLEYPPTFLFGVDDPLRERLRHAALDPASTIDEVLEAAEAFPQEALAHPKLCRALMGEEGPLRRPSNEQLAGAAALAKHPDLPRPLLALAVRSESARVACNAVTSPNVTPELLEAAYHNLAERPDFLHQPQALRRVNIVHEILRRLPLERARELAGDDHYTVSAVLARHDQGYEEALDYLKGVAPQVPEWARPLHHALVTHPEAPASLFDEVLANAHPLDWPDLVATATRESLPLVARALAAAREALYKPFELNTDIDQSWADRRGWRRGLYRLVERQHELPLEVLLQFAEPEQVDAHLYLAHDPRTPAPLLQALLHSGLDIDADDADIALSLIAAHPNQAWPERSQFIADAERLTQGFSADHQEFVQAGILAHPSTPLTILLDALPTLGPEMHYYIDRIAGRGLHEGLRQALITLDDPYAAPYALSCSTTTPEELAAASMSSALDVRLVAACHHRTPTSVLMLLQYDIEDEVAATASETLVDFQTHGRYDPTDEPAAAPHSLGYF